MIPAKTRHLFSIIFTMITFCYCQVQAMENPRQPVLDLEDQIEQLALDEGPFSETLFEPVMELARLYLEEQDYVQATDQLQRAQNIIHRHEGVYTPRQSEVVELLTEIAMAEADYKAADVQQKFAFFITTHHLDENDPAVLFAYEEMADWYIYTGQTRRARRLLEEGIDKAGSLGLDPVPLAIQLSQARRLEGICCSSKQLQQLVEQSGNSDPDTLANAYLELADSYILARKEELAAKYIQKAHELSPMSLSVDPRPISARTVVSNPRSQHIRSYDFERDLFNRVRMDRRTREEVLENLAVEPQWFIVDGDQSHRGFTVPDSNTQRTRDNEIQELVGHPLMFSVKQLNNLVPLRYEKNKDELTITLSFTVTDKGKPEEIEIISSTAPVRLNRLVVAALRKTYYRPALIDGQMVTTENVQLVQTFKSHYKGTQ